MSTQQEIREKYSLLKLHLKGRLRRLWAGAEAGALGKGGIKRVAEATGLSCETVSNGLHELRAGGPPPRHEPPRKRIRSRIRYDNDLSTQDVVCGSRDGDRPPLNTACEHAVKTSNTFFPCWRQVATMVKMLATKRPPATLSLP